MRHVTGKTSFGVAVAESVLTKVCDAANLDSSDARLIRLGENALFHLPAEAIVVRIARTMDYWDDAQNEVSVSRWLAESQFPAARVCKIAQPVNVSDHPVTFWDYIDGREGEREDLPRLAALLSRLHKFPKPGTFNLPNEDILGRVRRRIEGASVSSADKDYLMQRFEDLQAEVSLLSYPLPPAPTHGDAHVGNLMIHDGRAILIDFERFTWGHPEWDLSMTATEYQTAGWWTKAEYSSFTEAYGYDIMSWTEGFPILRAVHEIKMTTWLMQNVDESLEIAREYENRMRTIRCEVNTDPWRPF